MASKSCCCRSMKSWRSLTRAALSWAKAAALESASPMRATQPVIFSFKQHLSKIWHANAFGRRDDKNIDRRAASRLREPKPSRRRSADRAGDVRHEAGTRFQTRIPCLQFRHVGTLDGIEVPAVQPDTGDDVGERERIAGEVRLAFKQRLENSPQADRILAELFQRRLVALVFRRAVIAPHQRRQGRVELRELPVHPALDLAAQARLGRIEGRAAASRVAQIAADRVRFPDDEIAVLYRRHQPVWIHRPVARLIVAADLAADIEAIEIDAEIGADPQHLLHVGRVRPSPDFQHSPAPAKILSPSGPVRAWLPRSCEPYPRAASTPA